MNANLIFASDIKLVPLSASGEDGLRNKSRISLP